MGETRSKDGETLFERFQALLSSMGVEVDFVQDGVSTQAEIREEGPNVRTLPERAGILRRDKDASAGETRRRVSFDSALDTGSDRRRSTAFELLYESPRPRSTDVNQREQAPKISSQTRGMTRRVSNMKEPNRNLANGELRHSNAAREGYHPVRHVLAPRPLQGTNHEQINHVRSSLMLDEDFGSDASAEESFIEYDEDIQKPEIVVAAPHLEIPEARPDVVKLEAHAKSLRYHHLAANALSLYRDWRQKAQQVLVERARQEQETAAFYSKLETKATKARDMFLLSKAFSHWAQSTAEEVKHTSIARNHLLQTRYFNAWLEITVVNELKVRQHVLQKSVNCWKHQTAHKLRQQDQAVLYHGRKTFDRFYKRWFWHFCERRAPAWYASKLKITIVKRWVDKTKQSQITKQWALDFRGLELMRGTISLWAGRTKVIANNHDQAELFRRRNLIKPAVETLQRELLLLPMQARVARAIDTRVVYAALHTWLARARLSLRATQVDRLRVLRNAWTAWNDRLRCAALSRTIDDRIVLQVLYRWVLLERQALLSRVAATKVKQAFFQRWRTRTNELSEALGRANYHVLRQLSTRAKASVATIWTNKSQALQAQNEVAENFCSHYLRTRCLHLWTIHAQGLRSLDKTCSIARFYILTKTPLKRWQAAVTTSKRTRRREAYSLVRGRSKEASTLR